MAVLNKIDFKMEILDLLDWLSEFGKTEDDGITRTLYSDCWKEAQNELKVHLERGGFKVYYDEIGNLFSRLEGIKYKDETILTGSHIDTVINGGKLDGQLGIIGGIIAMTYLKETYGEPLRNIEMVSFAEEEGSRFPFTFWGSKNVIGSVNKEEVKDLLDIDGIRFEDAMERAGFQFKDKNRIRSDIKAFIELHVEQGGVLEIEGKSIGIVEHIVGQKRYIVEVEGVANHAGTTPMGYRFDALDGASRMIVKIIELAKWYGDPLVATIGKMEVFPNTSNVVPGKVTFSIDVRHTHQDISDQFTEVMENCIVEIAKELDLETNIENYMNGDPVTMDTKLIQIIEEKSKDEDLKYKLMHSGAGHDSQIFAPKIPTALIFVPSHKGISHNPLEFTDVKYLIEGVKLLTETLYELAYK